MKNQPVRASTLCTRLTRVRAAVPVPRLEQCSNRRLSSVAQTGTSNSLQSDVTRSYGSVPRKKTVILGLESSADDSCASIVTSDREILSNVVIKQEALLEQFGGIHPLHAQHSHARNVPLAIQRALSDAKMSLSDLDAIAFTRGPGMAGCLQTSAASAKALAAATGLPLLGVHHMQAHALTPSLTEVEPPRFPYLTLLLSGGHTLLLLARSETSFKILATTHDESIGQSLDKASRDLEIPLSLGKGSAGAALEAFAFGVDVEDTIDTRAVTTPPTFQLPFRNQLAFSYSGARSALTRLLEREAVTDMSLARRRQVAKAFMRSAFAQVEEKVSLGIKHFESENLTLGSQERLGGLVVSGGVASNQFLRQRLRHKLDDLGYRDMRLLFPPPHLCTDNAAMIAHVGISRLQRQRVDPLSVDIRSKWSIEDCESDFEIPA